MRTDTERLDWMDKYSRQPHSTLVTPDGQRHLVHLWAVSGTLGSLRDEIDAAMDVAAEGKSDV